MAFAKLLSRKRWFYAGLNKTKKIFEFLDIKMIDHEQEISVIGISPRNSYYSKDNIAFAITEVVQEFGKAYVFIPGSLDRHNYIAYGCKEENARTKALTLGEELKHAVREICEREGLTHANIDRSPAQVRIIDWDADVESSPVFKEKLGEVTRLYESSPEFRADIRAATLASLKTRMDRNAETRNRIQKTGIDPAIDRAVNYILGEFAFLEAAPILFQGSHTTYFYHRDWNVYQKYIDGNYDCARPAQSFRILNHQASDVK